MGWSCEEGYRLKLQERIWAEVVRRSLRVRCEAGYGLKLRGRLWAEVARKAEEVCALKLWGCLCPEVMKKALSLIFEEGYGLKLWERELFLLYAWFTVRNYFKARNYSLFILWEYQARQVYCYESLHLPGYPMKAVLLRTAIKKRAVCIITYMHLFLIYRSCFHLTLVSWYRPFVSTLCTYELIRTGKNHKNKQFFLRKENQERFKFSCYAYRLRSRSLINPLCPLKDKNWDRDNTQ